MAALGNGVSKVMGPRAGAYALFRTEVPSPCGFPDRASSDGTGQGCWTTASRWMSPAIPNSRAKARVCEVVAW